MVDELISENLEPFLAPPNLSRMDIKSLIGLRDQLDQRLREHRVKLQKQLERIALLGGERVRRGGGSALKGIKVPPKYRSPSGETWAGRGAKPRWLVAALKLLSSEISSFVRISVTVTSLYPEVVSAEYCLHDCRGGKPVHLSKYRALPATHNRHAPGRSMLAGAFAGTWPRFCCAGDRQHP